jgi:hypothetical protein
VKIIALTASQVLRRTDVAATQNLDEVGFRLPGVGGVALDEPDGAITGGLRQRPTT